MSKYIELQNLASKVSELEITDRKVRHYPVPSINDLRKFHLSRLQATNLSFEQYLLARRTALILTDTDLIREKTYNPGIDALTQSQIFEKNYSEHFDSLLAERINSKESKEHQGVPQPAVINDVFISHSMEDGRLAHCLKNLFKQLGIGSFVAHNDILQGQLWEATIINTIRQSKLMIVIATPDIEKSPWVNFECGMAYQKMFPILFEGLVLSDKVSFVKSKQGIVIRREKIQQGLGELVAKIALQLGKDGGEITTKILQAESLKNFKDLLDCIHVNIFKQTPSYSH